MASPGTQFMKEHEDFVLKLKIKATDGTSQIRRVRLPRIADISGAISYAELEGLVVTFSFPEESPEKYSVSLTYFDVDEDTVTIGSTDELVDAIEQFSGKKVLRISTEVKPKTKSEKKAEKKPAPVDKATQSTQEKPEEERSGSDVHPQIQNLLESFVGVLSTAVGSLQEGLASPESAPKVGQTSAQAAAAASAKKAPPSTDNDEGEVKSKAAPPRDVKEGPSREADSLAAGGSGEKDNAVRPFIHGRHTCDSCLTTPIVGNRYNSKNLPDYDLCENCHKNYKGNDIQFEAVELDRDRPFQERWHRRRERIMKNPSGRRARRFGGRPGWGRMPCNQGRQVNNASPPEVPQSVPPSDPPCQRPEPQEEPQVAPANEDCEESQKTPTPSQRPDPVCPPPPPPYQPGFFGFGPPRPHLPPPPPMWSHLGPHALPHLAPHFGPHHHSAPPHRPPPHVAPYVPHAPPQPNPAREFDDALKEAIRRSLRDVVAPEDDEVADAPTENEDVVASADGDEEPEKTVDSIGGNEEEPEGSDAPSRLSADMIVVDQACRSFSVLHRMKADAPSSASKNELVGDESISVVQEAGDFAETQTSDIPESPDLENAEFAECESVDSKFSDAVDVSREVNVSRDTTVDESFASDAVGNGDIAEQMGATLDMVAGVISEMLSEADADNMETPEKEQQTVASSSEAKVPGELIVDSGEGMKQAQESQVEESDWQLVKSNSSEEDSAAEETLDGEIGRAAEMLGSALFNSDMQTSTENVSTLSNSSNSDSSFSVPSTVPSFTSGSGVAAAQRSRWSSQLTTLQELGFEEALCVETLERLEAANIGVGSDDDISVTQVVNAIVGQK